MCGLLLLGCSAPVIAGLDCWQWRRPLPTSFNLTGVAQGLDRLVVVGNYGLVQTSIDGVSWKRVYSGSTNYLAEVCFGKDQFVAVGQSGQILVSTNAVNWDVRKLATWKDLGGIAYGNGQFVAFTSDSPYEILRSSDAATWSFQPFTNSVSLSQIRFCDGQFVGVGPYGIITSPDGDIWREATPAHTPYDATYADGKYVAVGDGYAFWSADLTNWTSSWFDFGNMFAVAHGNGRFVAVGASGQARVSTTGTNWSTAALPSQETYLGITFFKNSFVAVGSSGTAMCSTNGTDWTSSAGNCPVLTDVAKFADGYYAVGGSGQIITSSNGSDWKVLPTPTTADLYGIARGDGTFLAVGDSGTVLTSTNGISWRKQPSLGVLPLNAATYAHGLFVVVGPPSDILISPTGTNWSWVNVGGTRGLSDVICAADQYVAVGGGGRILTSPDGIAWTPRASGTSQDLYTILYTNGCFLAAGGALAISTDGVSWSSLTSPGLIYDIAYANDTYVAVGLYGAVWSSADGTNWIRRHSGLDFIGMGSIVAADGMFTGVGSGGMVMQATLSGPAGSLELCLKQPGKAELAAAVEVGKTYALQTSSNLETWSASLPFVPTQPLWRYLDYGEAGQPRRFYRLLR